MNISIPLENSVEFIDVTPISPLISKCQIKVCYVQEEPNRNGSIITKDVAKEMANSLPGCPIVGFYNEEKGDFEGHNQTIKIGDGNIEIKDTTIPYGFVDMNPKVWFQKFADGPNQEVHEYLMTEGYIWSGQFPEVKRVLTQGNNQSMELDDRFVDGEWQETSDGFYSFFIINDAIISKLCILGEEVEPCFEGAQINASFSLDEFSEKFKFMANELKEILDEGGQEMTTVDNNVEQEEVVQEEFSDEVIDEQEVAEAVVEDSEDENFGQKSQKDDKEKSVEDEDEYKKKRKCSLDNEDDVDYAQEYVQLFKKYTRLEEENRVLTEKCEKLENELTELRTYRLNTEREQKQEMIDSFYMLSDEQKKEVQDNIDKYSLDDIEAKLSVICVRNRVVFDEEERKDMTYNVNFSLEENVPESVKKLREHKNRY